MVIITNRIITVAHHYRKIIPIIACKLRSSSSDRKSDLISDFQSDDEMCIRDSPHTHTHVYYNVCLLYRPIRILYMYEALLL